MLVVAASAAFGAAFLHGQFSQLATALSKSKSVAIRNGTLAQAQYGGPQTLLLIGNDQRKHTTTNPVLPHSNEMLLVRIDPGKPWISMLSVPRELQVPIHTPHDGIVTTRLNASLFYGGIDLVVRTIKQVTGLSVNHVVVIDFQNFVKAVNEIGCVYGTIDRRYFHVNVPGGPQYFQVNLQPGYQDLCGKQALQFVTYRHDDTSLERDARDQAFMMDAKQQYGPSLVGDLGKFENILGHLVSTDASLHTASGVQSLFDTLISVAGLPVRQVKFQVDLDPVTNCECVTASPRQISESVDSFLYGKGLPPAKRSTAALAHQVDRSRSSLAVGQREQLVPLPAQTVAQARRTARSVPFPFEMPSVEVDNGYGFPTAFRTYRIKDPAGDSYPIYVEVYSTGLLGQYYDVQGTTWLKAPIFEDPSQTVTVAGRTYYVYYTGQHIEMLAWFANGIGYWVHNTLTSGLSNRQMLAVAESTKPLGGGAARLIRIDDTHQQAAPVSVETDSAQTSAGRVIGELGGVLAVLFVPLGFMILVLRRRELARLRAATAAAEISVQNMERRMIELRALPPGGQLGRSQRGKLSRDRR
ncbi:MAG: LCP family protein [Solirubrobacteraceae bacterium]